MHCTEFRLETDQQLFDICQAVRSCGKINRAGRNRWFIIVFIGIVRIVLKDRP
jgi:hypothetical protein